MAVWQTGRVVSREADFATLNRVSRITTAKGLGLNRDTIHRRHMTVRHRAMAVVSNDRPLVPTIWDLDKFRTAPVKTYR